MLADIDVDDYVVVSEHDTPGSLGEGDTAVAASPEADKPGLDDVGFVVLRLGMSLDFTGAGHGVRASRRGPPSRPFPGCCEPHR